VLGCRARDDDNDDNNNNKLDLNFRDRGLTDRNPSYYGYRVRIN
jgi:hypothetical protein